MPRAPIGLKIKKQRKSIGVTQAQLAERLGISPSYLNLIENNKRAIGGKLLQRISSELGMEIGALDGESDRRLIMELHELTTDPLFQNMDLTHETAPNLVGQHPRWARALKTLYRTYLDQAQTINALSDRLNYAPYIDEAVFRMLTNATAIQSSSEILGSSSGMSDTDKERFLSILSEESQKLSSVAEGLSGFMDNAKVQTRSLTPAEEVDDFIMEHGGYFDELENAAHDLVKEADIHAGDTESRLQDFLAKKFDVHVQFAQEGRLGQTGKFHQCSYNQITRTLEVPNYASSQTRRYEMACLLVELSFSSVISDEIKKSNMLISPVAQEWAASELIAYMARALLMPYDEFFEDAVRQRYDVDVLSRKYTVSFQQAASRLASLRKNGSQGIPFALMHTNPAGHILKRLTLPRLPIPRHGSACPIWDIYSSFQTPGRIVRQLAVFPNKERFLFFAKAETIDHTGFSQPRVLKATMLACDASHAEQTVYAEGLDMNADNLITKVGLNCRLCSWGDCAHREEDPILSQ
ncbi:Transcriptional regulator, XRE family protein [Candidatus Terasakiella magnetica]|uniref:Transcriptional regulator, XRE family protein n=1 Tax=Candidatus Terasakiella magnetica TaxID=1867952 RepID=A0A1C3RJS9_9PROT|nr:XRE family transcriptional regulator [Candidatus Terasakiella magnetica]SCA57499.1 Transcriptional regulator, XRE family protein [Candidatus Terasakiella magnetica]